MSIYASFLTFDGDEPPAPIVYRGSHILPSDEDDRGGLLMLALIPSFISRTGDDGPEDEAPLPWLRLSVAARIVTRQDVQPGEMVGTAPDMQDVLLDASQVREVRDALTGWFHAPEQDGGRSWVCPHCDGTGERPECQTSDQFVGGSQVAHTPTRAEVEAAVVHDGHCQAYGVHAGCCPGGECGCTAAEILNELAARGWLRIAGECADG